MGFHDPAAHLVRNFLKTFQTAADTVPLSFSRGAACTSSTLIFGYTVILRFLLQWGQRVLNLVELTNTALFMTVRLQEGQLTIFSITFVDCIIPYNIT